MFNQTSLPNPSGQEKPNFFSRLLRIFLKKSAAKKAASVSAPISQLTPPPPPTPPPSSSTKSLESDKEKEALHEQTEFYNKFLDKTSQFSVPVSSSVSSQELESTINETPKKTEGEQIKTLESELDLAKVASENLLAGEEVKTKEAHDQASVNITNKFKSSSVSNLSKSKSAPQTGLHVPQPTQGQVIKTTKEEKKTTGFLKGWFSKNLAHKLAKEKEVELAWQERNQVEKRFWQPANVVKPNLIKNQEITFFNWHENLLILGLSLAMCCLLIGLLYVGLLIWQKERIDTTRVALENTKVIDDQIEIGEREAVEIKDFTYKLNLAGNLLDNHIYWTNFFKFLEDNTLLDFYFENFSGDLSGEYALPAVAKNLDTVYLQLEVMKAYPKIKSLTSDTGETSGDGGPVKLYLGMSIDPTIFTK